MRLVFGFVLALVMALPVMAVEPGEVLDDPVLESRARDLSRQLRCPVCQGESIDESHAPISRDLRIAVRERLLAGDTDDEVLDYIVARFGEFVLFNPRPEGANILLWAAGPLMLVLGAGIAFVALRRRGGAEDVALSPEEEARLREVMRD